MNIWIVRSREMGCQKQQYFTHGIFDDTPTVEEMKKHCVNIHPDVIDELWLASEYDDMFTHYTLEKIKVAEVE